MSHRYSILVSCIATCLAGCASPPEVPAPWMRIGHGAGLVVSVDTLHIVRDSLGPHVRLRFDYDRPQHLIGQDSTAPNTPFRRTEIEEHLDCRAQRARNGVLEIFDSAGKSLGAAALPDSAWHTFAEAAPFAIYFHLACEELRAANKL